MTEIENYADLLTQVAGRLAVEWKRQKEENEKLHAEIAELKECLQWSKAGEAATQAARKDKEMNMPRRIQHEKMTPAELAIHAAMLEVEKAGAHPLLTDAVVLLEQAQRKVADYVDSQGLKED